MMEYTVECKKEDGAEYEGIYVLSSSQHENNVRKPKDGVGSDTLLPAPFMIPGPPADEISQRWVKEETPDFCQCVAWVQCAKESCKKWRRLPAQEDPWSLPEDWSCDHNTDGVYDRCDVAEASCSWYDGVTVYAEYVPGSVVWVKLQGYPWWPALVDYDPDEKKYFQFAKSEDPLPSKYHVTFFVEPVSRAWMSRFHLKPFQHFPGHGKEKMKNARMRRNLKLSIDMACNALSMGLQDRLLTYGFSVRSITEVKEENPKELSNEITSKEEDFLHIKKEATDENYIRRENPKELSNEITSKEEDFLHIMKEATDENFIRRENPKELSNEITLKEEDFLHIKKEATDENFIRRVSKRFVKRKNPACSCCSASTEQKLKGTVY